MTYPDWHTFLALATVYTTIRSKILSELQNLAKFVGTLNSTIAKLKPLPRLQKKVFMALQLISLFNKGDSRSRSDSNGDQQANSLSGQ